MQTALLPSTSAPVNVSLDQLMLAAPVAILAADENGQILFTNPKFDLLFGYERSELLGQPLELLLPESMRSTHTAHRNAYLQRPRIRTMGSGMDLIGRHKDGNYFPIEVGLSYLEVEERRVVMASVVDISVRKRTEELLEERVTERTRELDRRRRISEGLVTVLSMINANYPLAEILNAVLGHAITILGVDACAIVRNLAEGSCEVQVSKNLPVEIASDLSNLAYAQENVPLNDAVLQQIVELTHNRKVTQIFDMQSVAPTGIPAFDHYRERLVNYGLRAELIIPLLVRNEVYGSFRLYFRYPHVFLADELSQAQILCEQSALALENARLHADLKLAAVTAERNRIAHDLHDSVTQTLFSASMISDILPTLWQRRPEEAARRLTELRELTRGALAEMRTLLLELRPEALENIDLPELLKQLSTAFVGRSRIPLEMTIAEDCQLDRNVRTAFYRIAQEALNNVAKHAEANGAVLSLTCNGKSVFLCVEDDGMGFEITSVRGNHLGLNIMRERAAEIGARLDIVSTPGAGTKVSVFWSEMQS